MSDEATQKLLASASDDDLLQALRRKLKAVQDDPATACEPNRVAMVFLEKTMEYMAKCTPLQDAHMQIDAHKQALVDQQKVIDSLNRELAMAKEVSA